MINLSVAADVSSAALYVFKMLSLFRDRQDVCDRQDVRRYKRNFSA